MQLFYDREMDLDTALRVWKVRMWEKGHSFDEIERMSITQFGDVIGYWAEKHKAEEKLNKHSASK